MVNIEYYTRNDKIVKFIIKGHANAGDYGKDLVCSSVSSVSIMCLNGILEVLEYTDTIYTYDDGIIECDISELSEEEINKSNILIVSMIRFLEQLVLEYPKNIKIRSRRY